MQSQEPLPYWQFRQSTQRDSLYILSIIAVWRATSRYIGLHVEADCQTNSTLLML
jgi:hypothetical protein